MESNIQQLKNQAFEELTKVKWKETVEASLKGKPFESLSRNTYEGIRQMPLYTKEDIEDENVDQVPGADSFVRGFTSARKPWVIAQRLSISNEKQFFSKISTALKNGQEAISFTAEPLNVSQLDIPSLFKLAKGEGAPLFLRIKEHYNEWIQALSSIPDASGWKGAAAADILSSGLEKGEFTFENTEALKQWKQSIETAADKMPNVKTVLIDTVPFHNGGANAVQELAVALAEAVTYIELMKEQNWEPAKTIGKMVFHFAFGSRFFMELAKLRAFRKLWAFAASAYELNQDDARVVLSGETSAFTKAAVDPYVNILRSGSEAFAAVLGGVDYFHVAPFDETYQETGSFSERLARNTQLILREEANLGFVQDPAGGSYYVESLTNELVNKAWSCFQKIEKHGGLIEALKKGIIQEDIRITASTKLEDAYTRKTSIIGTNVYAAAEIETSLVSLCEENKGSESAESLMPVRKAEMFEKLKSRTHTLKEKGIKPEAGLICLGSLKEHKARMDFAAGFLAVAGIKAVSSSPCFQMTDIQSFMEEHSFPYYCLCGTNELYKEWAERIAEYKRKYAGDAVLDIAGIFPADEWESLKKAGFNGSLYMKQNLLKKLDGLLAVWEGF